jgi:hypothetical protein
MIVLCGSGHGAKPGSLEARAVRVPHTSFFPRNEWVMGYLRR